ncbi:hypothetical protein AWV79_17795 [Cupriavidus sp. UYMMa02A]|nr:hypothetical protein AWV80_14810 [Cupriavidus sp. UYMU48A]ODV43470.1 hypothetical protein AWV79_17795 [Cupriavidus sp. UYMMa02A]
MPCIEPILVAIDGSACADRALDEAIRLASLCAATMVIIHVVDNSYLRFDMGYTNLADLRPALVECGRKLLAGAA